MKIKWTGLLAALTLGWVNAAELPPPVIGGYYEVGGDYDSYPCDRVHPDYNILYNAFLQAGAAGELLLDQESICRTRSWSGTAISAICRYWFRSVVSRRSSK